MGVAAATTLGFASPARAAGANERLRVALIGCGGRGRDVASIFSVRDDVELLHIADPHQGRLAAAKRQFGDGVNPTQDFRHILDDRSIDAVIVATPVHWHAPATILACDAGKHVYVEKPCSHNIREGRLMVDAARRNNRVVQHGTQVRSTQMMIEATEMLRDGIIGKVLVAKAWNIQYRPGNGIGDSTAPPAELDFNMWLGPVPHFDYNSNVFGGWNWLRHFGTGEIGNDGVHDIEYARWGLGVKTHPTSISGLGARYAFDNGAEFPDTQQVLFEYDSDGAVGEKRMLIYEERLWSTDYPHNCDSGVEYYGTQGQM
ncbi:MAG: Gfo/Idh/MocA family protein, partial [Pirellulales bacterium]